MTGVEALWMSIKSPIATEAESEHTDKESSLNEPPELSEASPSLPEPSELLSVLWRDPRRF